MTTALVIFLSLIAMIGFLRLRRWLAGRSLTHYSARALQSGSDNLSGKIFLDVRSAQERSHNAIKGSVHIPLHELRNRVDELDKYRNREIICFCQSGSRSIAAVNILKRQGFTAANLRGGISEWNFQNVPP
jgi:rhodanese-related sulfurtransferase